MSIAKILQHIRIIEKKIFLKIIILAQFMNQFDDSKKILFDDTRKTSESISC